MTYQNTSQPFAARTSARGPLTSTAPFQILRRGISAVAAVMAAFGASLMRAAEASSRIDRVEALQAKSDAELAKMGITRDDIVRHVFRDLYYV